MTNTVNYIGLMSGTSLDGVDGVIVQFSNDQNQSNTMQTMQIMASANRPFTADIKQEALALQQAGDNEIHREALLANKLASIYAQCVEQLVQQVPHLSVSAIGVHGQTIRHRPELSYTRQTNNPALLAELSNIDVIADFRSRDIAAGGQGAPLVPAFHRAIFGAKQDQNIVVVNIGGMSNISILHAAKDKETNSINNINNIESAAIASTFGFDTGPGNVLMDAWIHQHLAQAYDANGAWAAQGNVNDALLASFLEEAFFHQAPPKSTGRDLFDLNWLQHQLRHHTQVSPVDVQATLCALTARTIANAITQYAPQVDAVYVCGGGAYNQCLMKHLQQHLQQHLASIPVKDTSYFGVAPNHVEAIAFAWLAQQFSLRQMGNLPQVTGAKGERILGALYPA